MEDQLPEEPNKAGEHQKPIDSSSKLESDPESIANRVVDVFWESLHASQEDES